MRNLNLHPNNIILYTNLCVQHFVNLQNMFHPQLMKCKTNLHLFLNEALPLSFLNDINHYCWLLESVKLEEMSPMSLSKEKYDVLSDDEIQTYGTTPDDYEENDSPTTAFP